IDCDGFLGSLSSIPANLMIRNFLRPVGLLNDLLSDGLAVRGVIFCLDGAVGSLHCFGGHFSRWSELLYMLAVGLLLHFFSDLPRRSCLDVTTIGSLFCR